MIYIIHRTVYYIYGPNHAVKCYQDALEKLVAEKPHYKGKGKLTVAMRKCLTTAARCAIKMWSTGRVRRQAGHCFNKICAMAPSTASAFILTVVQTVTRSSQTPDTTNILIPERVSSRGEENASLRRSLRLSTLSLRSCRPTLTRC